MALRMKTFQDRLLWLWGREAPALPRYYRQVFDSEGDAGSAVLADLAAFCLAAEATYVPGDSQASAFNEGRRAVWLHIQAMREETGQELSQHLDRINRNRREDDV